MKKLKDMGVDDNTIVVFTTDNGTEIFTWPDGGKTPFAQQRDGHGRRLPRARASCAGPAMCRRTRFRTASSPAWTGSPTFVAAAGNPNIAEELLKGKQLGDRTYKIHLDGYDQMDAITGKGPSRVTKSSTSPKARSAPCGLTIYKYRFTDQPGGWLGATEKVDWPILTNLRLDPYERTGMFNGKDNGSIAYYNWFVFEFWRFVFVQQVMGKEIQTFLDYPPMQKGASFNLDAVKAEMAKKMEEAEAASKGTGQ